MSDTESIETLIYLFIFVHYKATSLKALPKSIKQEKKHCGINFIFLKAKKV